MSQPTESLEIQQKHLINAYSQEIARLNDNRIYLLAVVAQQAEELAGYKEIKSQKDQPVS